MKNGGRAFGSRFLRAVILAKAEITAHKRASTNPSIAYADILTKVGNSKKTSN